MKIEYHGNEMILYIYTCNYLTDFTDKKEIEAYFKTLFNKLKDFYGVELTGFYHITVYYDSTYGVILVLEKEELEYYPAFEETLDMRITVAPIKTFLYEVEDILNKEQKKNNYYHYQGKYYLEVQRDLTEIEKGLLLESARPIFGEEVDDIRKYGKKIEI